MLYLSFLGPSLAIQELKKKDKQIHENLVFFLEKKFNNHCLHFQLPEVVRLY